MCVDDAAHGMGVQEGRPVAPARPSQGPPHLCPAPMCVHTTLPQLLQCVRLGCALWCVPQGAAVPASHAADSWQLAAGGPKHKWETGTNTPGNLLVRRRVQDERRGTRQGRMCVPACREGAGSGAMEGAASGSYACDGSPHACPRPTACSTCPAPSYQSRGSLCPQTRCTTTHRSAQHAPHG